jgi:phosphohistidine swiveling domain-containing protein
MVADQQLIVPLNRKSIPLSAGNKALNLQRLSQLGLIVPKTFVIPWKAYQRYLEDDVSLVDELKQALNRCLEPEKAYAVRSSANIEDSLDFSFAGQFKSVLNQRGVESVLQAIWSVWATARSERVISYLEQHGIDNRDLFMGVIVQEMVPSVYAGVALSRNPVTSADEVIVEAVQGYGESLVQSGVTPLRWINKWDNWLVKPCEEAMPLVVLEEIVTETRRIAHKLNAFVDLEWVFDGDRVVWLQVREITSMNRHNVFSNHISKEVIPGMIKPLIGSINIPLVCAMWVQLINELLGKTGVQPETLADSFYYRVYFNMGTLGQIFQEVGMSPDSVETLMGVVPKDANKPGMKPTLKTFLRLPRLLGFLVSKWFFARRIEQNLPGLIESFQGFTFRKAPELTPRQLLQEIDRLYQVVQATAYYNIASPIIAMIYLRILQNQLAKLGVDWLMFDLMEGMTAAKKYDPNHHLHNLHEAFTRLDVDTKAAIQSGSYDDILRRSDIPDFRKKVAAFLDRFGHLSDHGNDFSTIPWRETPDIILDMIVNYAPAREKSVRKIRWQDIDLRGFKRWWVGIFYRRARAFQLFREQVSYHYTYGYGLFRYYYLALGSHLVQADHIDAAEDIFYLEDTQVRQLIQESDASLDARQEVARHKADMEKFRDISLPAVIYGDTAPPISDHCLEKLVGVPTSLGYYTGKVTVVRGLNDFAKVQPGDVLVIPYSEVSWTSLFAKAGAVVAESGGLLSHSSIVAREYNIPAVVSVDGAMRLSDQVLVTVNGHTGEVFIHETDLGCDRPQEMEQ